MEPKQVVKQASEKEAGEAEIDSLTEGLENDSDRFIAALEELESELQLIIFRHASRGDSEPRLRLAEALASNGSEAVHAAIAQQIGMFARRPPAFGAMLTGLRRGGAEARLVTAVRDWVESQFSDETIQQWVQSGGLKDGENAFAGGARDFAEVVALTPQGPLRDAAIEGVTRGRRKLDRPEAAMIAEEVERLLAERDLMN